ncbi:hypothetical protein GW17_00008923, partial [Ensete ventricosum]
MMLSLLPLVLAGFCAERHEAAPPGPTVQRRWPAVADPKRTKASKSLSHPYPGSG